MAVAAAWVLVATASVLAAETVVKTVDSARIEPVTLAAADVGTVTVAVILAGTEAVALATEAADEQDVF